MEILCSEDIFSGRLPLMVHQLAMKISRFSFKNTIAIPKFVFTFEACGHHSVVAL